MPDPGDKARNDGIFKIGPYWYTNILRPDGRWRQISLRLTSQRRARMLYRRDPVERTLIVVKWREFLKYKKINPNLTKEQLGWKLNRKVLDELEKILYQKGSRDALLSLAAEFTRLTTLPK